MSGYIYLASPYSHPDPCVREGRYMDAMRAAAELTRQGVIVYAPIVYGHHLAAWAGVGTDWDAWHRHAYAMLQTARELWVLTSSGWRESRGVAAEIKYAEGMGIPVQYSEVSPGVLRNYPIPPRAGARLASERRNPRSPVDIEGGLAVTADQIGDRYGVE